MSSNGPLLQTAQLPASLMRAHTWSEVSSRLSLNASHELLPPCNHIVSHGDLQQISPTDVRTQRMFLLGLLPPPCVSPKPSDPSVMGAPCQSLSVKVLLAPAGSRGLCVSVTGTPPTLSSDFRHSPPAPALFRWGPFPMALPTLEGETRPRPSPWTEAAGERRH